MAKALLFEPFVGELTGFEQARLSRVLRQVSLGDQSPARHYPLSPMAALCHMS